MAKAFEFQKGDLDKLKRFYRKAPGMFRRAGVGLSNNLAFKARGLVLAELEQSMTIRSPGFVKGSVRVQKARFGNPTAEVGSIKRERFSGWAEQESGKKTARTRTQSRIARSNNWKRRVAPRFRLKPGKKRSIRPSDLGFNNAQSSSIAPFLQILDRRKYRQAFFIPIRYKRLQRGIYIFRAKKIRRIQNLDPADPQPKRNRWMTKSVNQINQPLVEREWEKTVRFVVGKVRL
jgi:hypothetical protein